MEQFGERFVADSGELYDPGGALDEVLVREHGLHHVAAGHEDGLVGGQGPVVQAEEDVGELALDEAEVLQLALEDLDFLIEHGNVLNVW